jgi:hypothetical protein|tara:strand:+ start:1843 stop:2016 length:174 start_codon:yes stop_codon:yes gene_type:complete
MTHKEAKVNKRIIQIIVEKYWRCEHHACQGCNCTRQSEALVDDLFNAFTTEKMEEKT